MSPSVLSNPNFKIISKKGKQEKTKEQWDKISLHENVNPADKQRR